MLSGSAFLTRGLIYATSPMLSFGKGSWKQANGTALQIWYANGTKWLRKEEYADDVTQNLRADTLEDLAGILVTNGLKDKASCLSTNSEFNDAADAIKSENPDGKFDPAVRDGASTQSIKAQLLPRKANRAIPIKKGLCQ